MNQKQQNHFKTLLESELATLVEELRAIAKQDQNGDWVATPDAHTDVEDEADSAGHVEDFESKIARLDSLEKRYGQVTSALERIANGTYGICVKSGKPIEEDRLEANPAAETCKEMMG